MVLLVNVLNNRWSHIGSACRLLPVGTKAQDQSGLGLDGQREVGRGHLTGGDGTLLGKFTDVESGKAANRSQSKLAMELARLTGATLLIAKLDRLSRDAYCLLGLQKAAWFRSGRYGKRERWQPPRHAVGSLAAGMVENNVGLEAQCLQAD